MRGKMLMLGLALVAAGAVSGAAPALPGDANARYQAGFSATVDNPWLPLRPGTTYVYRGSKDGKAAREVLRVTGRITRIAGAPCVVVEDRLYLEGMLHERTIDWYSQDRAGNVWYFGEETAELDRNGKVTSTEGSFRAGRDGAKQGLFMFAHPKVGQSALQESYKGHAEDHFSIIGLFGTVIAPPAKNAVLTREWTPLEPGVIDHKLYVRGIGVVLEESVKGGNERLELETVTKA